MCSHACWVLYTVAIGISDTLTLTGMGRHLRELSRAGKPYVLPSMRSLNIFNQLKIDTNIFKTNIYNYYILY